jgi:peptidylprolyl isomerase
MARARQGDMVRVYCAGRLADGSEFELSSCEEPMEFIVGHEDLLPDLEQAVVGMAPGESKVVVMAKGKGYGPRREDLIQVIDRDEFPEGIEPKIGLRLRVPAPGYEVINATVVNVTGTKITLDANHPLAGQDVLLQITLLEIVPM